MQVLRRARSDAGRMCSLSQPGARIPGFQMRVFMPQRVVSATPSPRRLCDWGVPVMRGRGDRQHVEAC